MKILSDINSADLTERLDKKAEKYNGFTKITSSQTIIANAGMSGKVYQIENTYTVTVEHGNLEVGGFLLFIQNDTGTASIQTTADTSMPTSSCDIAPGQHCTWIWNGADWMIFGNYTF